MPTKKKPLSPGEEILRSLLLDGKITEADLASFRNRLLGSRASSPKKRKANAANAKKTAGVPRPNARKPASTQEKTPPSKKSSK